MWNRQTDIAGILPINQVEAELSCDIRCSRRRRFPAFPPRISRAEDEGQSENKVIQLIMSVWVEEDQRRGHWL
jgi:hypothetical protein